MKKPKGATHRHAPTGLYLRQPPNKMYWMYYSPIDKEWHSPLFTWWGYNDIEDGTYKL